MAAHGHASQGTPFLRGPWQPSARRWQHLNPIALALFLCLSARLPIPAHAQAAGGPALPPLSSYTSSLELEPDTVYLFWTHNESDARLNMAVHAKTAGWVAVGISEVGAMVGSGTGCIPCCYNTPS